MFVEAKRRPYLKESFVPYGGTGRAGGPEDSPTYPTLEQIKGFNSRINGQLELRWRFCVALRQRQAEGVVTEEHVKMPNSVLANDVFYYKEYNVTRQQQLTKYRSVQMDNELNGLYRELLKVDEFYLLALTLDPSYPPGLDKVRLFDEAGNIVCREESQHRIFWMPFDVLMDGMERYLPDNEAWA